VVLDILQQCGLTDLGFVNREFENIN
jgi:hypothetical protein